MRIYVAKILPKMAPPELTFGEHFVEIEGDAMVEYYFIFLCFFQLRQNVHEKCGLSDKDIIQALDWCISHHNDDPANPLKIVSMSFGNAVVASGSYCDSENPTLSDYFKKLNSLGITLFVASGNEYFTDAIARPACLQSSIAVGAVFDSDFQGYEYVNRKKRQKWKENVARGSVTKYSNSAPILDLLGPADWTRTPAAERSGFFNKMNGTSAATPYVAGVAALLQSRFFHRTGKYLSPQQVRDILADKGRMVTDDKSGLATPLVDIASSLAYVDSLSSVPPEAPGGGKKRIMNILRGKIRQ